MTETVRIHNGPREDELSAEELARLFADPTAGWGNLEIAVRFARGYASVHWSGFTRREVALGSGFLVRHAGESPLGAVDSPEVVTLFDGGAEPFAATARHLLDAAEVGWLVWQLGRGGGARPKCWPDGRPLVWSDPMIDEAPWRGLGTLEEPYHERRVTLTYDAVPGDDEAKQEPPWAGQRSMRLAARGLTEREAEALPRSTLWQVLRHLHEVTDARWLALLGRHPMPWLSSLILTLDELTGLGEAVGRQPRLEELVVHAACEALPAIASGSLEELLLEGMDGGLIDGFLRESRLPALRVLAIFSEALAGPIDFSRLPAEAVVHVDCVGGDDLAVLGHAVSARRLALELGDEQTAEALVAALDGRGEREAWISTLWEPAQAAVRLAEARGIRLRVR